MPISGRIMGNLVRFELNVTANREHGWTVRGKVPGGFGIDTTLRTPDIIQLDTTFFDGRTPTFHQLQLEQGLRLPTFDELAA